VFSFCRLRAVRVRSFFGESVLPPRRGTQLVVFLVLHQRALPAALLNCRLEVRTSSGTNPFTYQWSNGAITKDLTDVDSGVYTVTVTAAGGCTTTATTETHCCESGCADHCNEYCPATTGLCAKQPKTGVTSCDDNNKCMIHDTCSADGLCVGTPKDCTALDQCHYDGQCNHDTGTCTNTAKPNGSPCDDGVFCTGPDTCTKGACSGGPLDRSKEDDQCNSGVCNEIHKQCEKQAANEGPMALAKMTFSPPGSLSLKVG
jgi:hypothetical protein